MTKEFLFAGTKTSIYLQQKLPGLQDICASVCNQSPHNTLIISDVNTECFIHRIAAGFSAPVCVLNAGEAEKTWPAIEKILFKAKNAGLGRDSLFIGVGGGVITDIAGFAASIYMRGVRLAFVSTTLLGMADAALGGKTGFDLFGLKNLVGSFYPAAAVFMPIETLQSLPEAELKSGFAEIIKTAILNPSSDDDTTFKKLCAVRKTLHNDELLELISDTVEVKGRIVEKDPRETGKERATLNLGHTFAHALESDAGLGVLSHGEAVAWGIARSCELGLMLGITPQKRAGAILQLLENTGYEIRKQHPAMKSLDSFMSSLESDKKKSETALRFIVPGKRGAEIVIIEPEKKHIISDIIQEK